MARDPLRTKLCDMLGIEFPIISFTHCKDVAVAVINAGGFAVLGEAMHTPDDIAADIARWETFSVRFLRDYFRSLRYEFGPDYQQGLLTYLEKAKQIGAIKRIPRLRFVEVG